MQTVNRSSSPHVCCVAPSCLNVWPRLICSTTSRAWPWRVQLRSTCSVLWRQKNKRAIESVRQVYPALSIVGHCHGYLTGDALARKVEEINSLAPDIVWVALGVPREQEFCSRFRQALCNVGIIKTSGGLFNFLSGAHKRAPAWMQKSCLEWMYRTKEEPRRLFWRYFITSPHALLLLITRSV